MHGARNQNRSQWLFTPCGAGVATDASGSKQLRERERGVEGGRVEV